MVTVLFIKQIEYPPPDFYSERENGVHQSPVVDFSPQPDCPVRLGPNPVELNTFCGKKVRFESSWMEEKIINTK